MQEQDIGKLQDLIQRTTDHLDGAYQRGDVDAANDLHGKLDRLHSMAQDVIKQMSAQVGKVPGTDNGGPTNMKAQGEPLYKAAKTPNEAFPQQNAPAPIPWAQQAQGQSKDPMAPGGLFNSVPQAPTSPVGAGQLPSTMQTPSGLPPETGLTQGQLQPWNQQAGEGSFAQDALSRLVPWMAKAPIAPAITGAQGITQYLKDTGMTPKGALQGITSATAPLVGLTPPTDSEWDKFFGSLQASPAARPPVQATAGPGGQPPAPVTPKQYQHMGALEEATPFRPETGAEGTHKFMLPWEQQNQDFQKQHEQEETDTESERQHQLVYNGLAQEQHRQAVAGLLADAEKARQNRQLGIGEGIGSFLAGGVHGLAGIMNEREQRAEKLAEAAVAATGASSQAAQAKMETADARKAHVAIEQAKMQMLFLDKREQEAKAPYYKKAEFLKDEMDSRLKSLVQDPKASDQIAREYQDRIQKLIDTASKITVSR